MYVPFVSEEDTKKTQAPDVDLNVLIFIRPGDNPVKITHDKNIRINYGGRFVDFRDGKLRVTDENTGEVISTI